MINFINEHNILNITLKSRELTEILSSPQGGIRGGLLAWIRSVAADYGKKLGEITYIFCDDERILAVNREFLQHDYYTDVITFDYSAGNTISGDIFISLDTVRTNAEDVGATFEEELHRIIIHGILHLTGQADKTPETRAEMTRKENLALAKLPR